MEGGGGIKEGGDKYPLRWMCIVRLEDKISADELRTRIKLSNVRECSQDRRLQWFGYLEIMQKTAWSSK